MPVNWSQYVRRITRGQTQTQIAERSGVAQTNIGRWLRGDPGMPRAESVVALARAYGQPPTEALVAAGYITAPEGESTGRTPLSAYSTSDLLDELRRRTRD